MKNEKKRLVPRLRFPEFRDVGEWEEKPLSDCCHLQAGKFVRANDIHEKSAVDRYPCYGGNGLRGYTKTFTHSGQYPLIGRQGAQCGNVNLANGKFHATEHAVVATANDGVSTTWLFYKLKLDFCSKNNPFLGNVSQKQSKKGQRKQVVQKRRRG